MNHVVLDTNILLRLAEPDHLLHGATAKAVAQLRLAQWQPVLLPQVAYEFWAVATRSTAANGLGMPAEVVLPILNNFTSQIPVLRDDRGVYEQWRRLVAQYAITGVNSHDLRIVAAMVRHRTRALLTSNDREFKRYTEIDVMTPDSVLMSPTKS
jgi:predicted nucleic acid-binding protein